MMNDHPESCGTCWYFQHEDMEGNGTCALFMDRPQHCEDFCGMWESKVKQDEEDSKEVGLIHG